MNHYDTTTLQTKTCGNVAKLIINMVDYLIEGTADKTKKREVLMEAANFLRQHNAASNLVYGGIGGANRYQRELNKKKVLW